jgi:hypothetical protein
MADALRPTEKSRGSPDPFPSGARRKINYVQIGFDHGMA